MTSPRNLYGGPLPLLAVFALAILMVVTFRSLAPQSVRPNEATDFRWYRQVAENVKEGHGLTLDDGRVATGYPPGFPLVLAGLFWLGGAAGLSEPAMINLVIPLMIGASAVLAFAIGRRLFGTGVGGLAALLWITYPMNLAMSSQPYSELLFTPLVYLAVLVFVAAFQSDRQAVASSLLVGMLIGVASLVRAIGIGLVGAFIVAVWVWARRRPIRTRVVLCLALLAGNLLVVLPWEAYGYARTGQVLALSSGGGDSMYGGLTFGFRPEERGSVTLPGDVRALLEPVAEHPEAYRSTGQVAQLLASNFVHHPVAVVKLLAIKAGRAWYATSSARLERIIMVVQLIYLVLITIGIALAVRRERYGAEAAWLLGGITGYFWLITMTVLPLLRYMTPAVGLLLLFAAYAIWAFWARTRSRLPVHA